MLGLLLAACPKPNGYTAVHAFPQFDFERMVGLQFIPGEESEAVVLTQAGVIYRAGVADTVAQPAVFLDLRDRLIANPGNEEGLLGLAFAPDFATSRRFYVNYTAGEPRRNVISRFLAAGSVADPASERVLLEIGQPYANHNGGGMAFGPDGYLYIGSGDGGSAGDPQGNGQRLDTLLGKILRIDVSGDGYSIPGGNPWIGVPGARAEIWAFGLRNPWRVTFDRETGDLWAGDVGQGAWEEVDRVVRAGNYGWNVVEGDACFRARDCNREGLIQPRASYGHDEGCSVTGGYVYRGSDMPELRGWYVYGDYCSGKLWALDASRDEGAPIPLGDTGLSIASFAEDLGGELYAVTFERAIYKIVRKP